MKLLESIALVLVLAILMSGFAWIVMMLWKFGRAWETIQFYGG